MFSSRQEFKFKLNNSLEKRQEESSRILKKYPDRIPIIVECSSNSTIAPEKLDKNKYLVPKDLTVSQFLYILRKRIKLRPEESILIFIVNQLPPTSEQMYKLYNQFKDQDDFLYCQISGEHSFGY